MNRELCIMKHGMFVIKNPSTIKLVEGFFLFSSDSDYYVGSEVV